MPNMIQAGTYSTVMTYLKAVRAAGTKDADAVAQKIRETPVNDDFAVGKVLANGRFIHDMYLFQVKSPAESKGSWTTTSCSAPSPATKPISRLPNPAASSATEPPGDRAG